MGHPLVSVMILTYNNSNYLEQCIDSVLHQNYPNIEIIISDDCSKTFNKTAFESYIEKNKYGNIVNYQVMQNEANLGIVKNSNHSIKKCNGDFIVPLDCDDCFYDEQVIRLLVAEFQKTDATIITGYMDEYDQSLRNFLRRSPEKRKLIFFNNMDQLFEELCRRNFIAGACTSYSRKLIDRYGFLDENYKVLDDYPLYLKLARSGERIHFINRTIIKYRLGGISTGKAKNPLLEADMNRVLSQEILPFKEKISTHLYREKMFDYRRRTEKKLHLFLISWIYLDVIVVRIMLRVKNLLKNLVKRKLQISRR